MTSSSPNSSRRQPISRTVSRPPDGAEIIRLLLSHVRSFVDVNLLRKTIAGMPGVQAVQFRPEGQGTFTAFVTYEGMVPFAVHLSERLSHRSGGVLPAHVTVEEYESAPASTIPSRRLPGARAALGMPTFGGSDSPGAA